MIVIVDYGVGNIASLLNMFEFVGVEARASNDRAEIADAAKLVLPGVGAFDRAMSILDASGLIGTLDTAVKKRKVPVLGVCLGMQLLAEGSEEGKLAGLGWVEGRCRKIATDAHEGLKVPNNGWQVVSPARPSVLFPVADELNRFYFNHSYHLRCENTSDIAATVRYGDDLCCAVEHGNVMGAQFHPEKSHRFGMRLLKRFADA